MFNGTETKDRKYQTRSKGEARRGKHSDKVRQTPRTHLLNMTTRRSSLAAASPAPHDRIYVAMLWSDMVLSG